MGSLTSYLIAEPKFKQWCFAEKLILRSFPRRRLKRGMGNGEADCKHNDEGSGEGIDNEGNGDDGDGLPKS